MGDRKVYLYKDKFTSDDMFNGAYPCSLVDDVVFCVEGKAIPKGGDKIDVGCGNAFGEVDQEVDDSVEMVINVIDTSRLQQTSFDKKGFIAYIKAYLGRIRLDLEKNNPPRVEPFMRGAESFIKKVISNFSDFDFFLGESMDMEAGVVLRFYKEDGITPYFYFFRDGVVLVFPGYGRNIGKEALVPSEVAKREGFII